MKVKSSADYSRMKVVMQKYGDYAEDYVYKNDGGLIPRMPPHSSLQAAVQVTCMYKGAIWRLAIN